MARLTRDDVMKAQKILKLIRHAKAASGPERDAYLRKAAFLLRNYRHGNAVRYGMENEDGQPE